MTVAETREPIPPTPPEPVTFGHVVIDKFGKPWVRTFEGFTLRAAWASGPLRRFWTQIHLPEGTP